MLALRKRSRSDCSSPLHLTFDRLSYLLSIHFAATPSLCGYRSRGRARYTISNLVCYASNPLLRQSTCRAAVLLQMTPVRPLAHEVRTYSSPLKRCMHTTCLGVTLAASMHALALNKKYPTPVGCPPYSKTGCLTFDS